MRVRDEASTEATRPLRKAGARASVRPRMRRSPLSGRRVVAGVCAALSILALAAGAIFLYLRVELLEEQGFADRTVEAVRDPQVRATIAVDIADAADLIVPAVRSVDPELAEDLPARLEAPLATLDRRDFAADTIEFAEQVRFLALVLPLLGIALLGTAVLLSDHPGPALRRAPPAAAGPAGAPPPPPPPPPRPPPPP